ncbi:(2Fe-2S)-binding protein [Polynucleobacter necessarius]|uniref:(2Fe-2S)-binding protein n=1 Tax=Polynucleobacter necessarius TaxID=576610 RepID=UPI001E38A842|nr:2Fe-2S iron-sulfur cluster-binding protein [Polynucleobacter necessarius]
MTLKKKISMTVNGQLVNAEIEPRRHLVDYLREDLHLKGAHLGCEQGACGACVKEVDGQIICGCLFLTVQADGSVVETVEGLKKMAFSLLCKSQSCVTTRCSVDFALLECY